VTATVLLAFTSADDDGPAALLPIAGVPIVRRLLDQVAAEGPVMVLTWKWWQPVVQDALRAVRVVGVDSHADALPRIARHAQAADAAADATAEADLEGEPIVLLHAHLVADPLAVGRLADGAAGGTGTLVAAPGWPVGWPVRHTRGRVVAAGSAYHRVGHANGLALHALRVGVGDLEALRGHAADLADLHDLGIPAGWVEELAHRHAQTGVPAIDPQDDLISLLLVAAVRSGRPVTAVPLPTGCVWELPRHAIQVAASLVALRAVDDEAIRLRAAVKDDDGFFTTFFVSSYSRYVARWAARHGIGPNQVTSASMAFGVAAALAFAAGGRWWALAGAVLLQVAFMLDCVDGQLARYARRFSTFGAWLDAVFDRGKEYAVYAGLAAGAVRAGGDAQVWWLAGAALAVQTFRHTLDLGYAEQQRTDVDAAVRQPLAPVHGTDPSFWEPVAGTDASTASAPTPAGGAGGFARRVVTVLRRAEAVALLRWGKRIVVLPIGERFLLISVLAVLAPVRVLFLVLLAWSALAALYTLGGRVIRSFA
jgi:phosphatidylglycerophosphate synthase